ncbi:SRPBCC domain-containing protein [Flavobacteriaceae bacterium AU392]|nr:SRPBCC domain-containing protein [Flavobacteriaceae bacterium]RKM85642.1 SRPBCC domain-containing protein [Flavobacteriaceae bacterium AU392]
MNAIDKRQTSIKLENSFSIHHDLFIKSDSKTIFDAITQPEHLNNWWTLECSGEPKLNTEYNFYFTPEYNWYGKVIQCMVNESFYIKMTKSDTDWNPTSFGFDLEKMDNGVQLRFSHIGWHECNNHFRRSSFCWAMLLNGLKNYLDKGIIIPFEERE